MIATVAQAETIYVTPGAVVHWQTKASFKTAISGDDKLLVALPGATDKDLLIVAKRPDDSLIGSANVVLLDDKGNLVQNLDVQVTPFGGPSKSVQVLQSGKKTDYLCANTCIDAGAAKNKGTGDADSVTVTRHSDGSTETWKHSSTPPSPP
jgi:hypothetical protein